ncbi:uncharacterized protein LOC143017948 [Oratosquilla oratoria]|uniref:uncharacterized protein LOC143017948 n=1 Tax=Oratosquilla oratoria TaxID=337810 RepID=UPI003F75AF3D
MAPWHLVVALLTLPGLINASEVSQTSNDIGRYDLESFLDKITEMGATLDTLAQSVTSTGPKLVKALLNLVEALRQPCGSKESTEDEHLQELKKAIEALEDRHSGSCRPPFFRVGNDCLYVNQLMKKTWQESRSLCMALGGDLAVPSDLYRLTSFLKQTTGDPKSVVKREFQMESKKGGRLFLKAWASDKESINIMCHEFVVYLFAFLKIGDHIQNWVSFLAGNDRFWLGASDLEREGDWRWVNGSTMNCPDWWTPGEPNDAGIGQDCLDVNLSHPPLLFDSKCGDSCYCVCQDTKHK